jgi:hypothetical protein
MIRAKNVSDYLRLKSLWQLWLCHDSYGSATFIHDGTAVSNVSRIIFWFCQKAGALALKSQQFVKLLFSRRLLDLLEMRGHAIPRLGAASPHVHLGLKLARVIQACRP